VSKHYRIKFSPPEAELNVVDEQRGPMKLKLRTVEKAMLCNLFDVFGAQTKKIGEQRVAADNWANVDAVSADAPEASVLLTEEDYKQLISGHEVLAGQRPHLWSRCRALLAQLENPTEEKVE
jgi:hypothetical protein